MTDAPKGLTKSQQSLLWQQGAFQLAFAPFIVGLIVAIGAMLEIDPGLTLFPVLIIAAGLPAARSFGVPVWVIFAGLAVSISANFRISSRGFDALSIPGHILFIGAAIILTSVVMQIVKSLYSEERKRPLVLGGSLFVLYAVLIAGIATDGFRPSRKLKRGPPVPDIATTIPEAQQQDLDFAFADFDWDSSELPKWVFPMNEFPRGLTTIRKMKDPPETIIFYGKGTVAGIREHFKSINNGVSRVLTHQVIRVRFENGSEVDIYHDAYSRRRLNASISDDVAVLGSWQPFDQGNQFTTESMNFAGWLEWNGEKY